MLNVHLCTLRGPGTAHSTVRASCHDTNLRRTTPENHFLALFVPHTQGKGAAGTAQPQHPPPERGKPAVLWGRQAPPGGFPGAAPGASAERLPRSTHPPGAPGHLHAAPRRPRAPPGRTHPARAARSRRHPGNGRFRRQGRAARGPGAALVPQEGRLRGGDVLVLNHSFPVLFGG